MENEAGAALSRLYQVGRDRGGGWLAMESEGKGGGMFASRDAAMRFAGRETGWRPGAVTESDGPITFA